MYSFNYVKLHLHNVPGGNTSGEEFAPKRMKKVVHCQLNINNLKAKESLYLQDFGWIRENEKDATDQLFKNCT